MKPAPTPPDERRRLAALRALEILDTPAEERFDRITRLAQNLFDVPIALVSLVDADRQWFKSKQGLDAPQTPRDVSFCGHAVAEGSELFIVPDSRKDARFADNPLVTGDPTVVFYAGCPLSAPGGEPVGTLCLIDRRPRELSEQQKQVLRDLGKLVEAELAAAGQRRREAARPAASLASGARRVQSVLGALVILFIGSGGLYVASRVGLKNEEERLRRSFATRTALASVLSAAQGAEGAARGYALSGRDSELHIFESESTRLLGSVAELRRLAAGSPRLEERLPGLEATVNERLGAVRKTVSLARSGGTPAAAAWLRTGFSQAVMARLRASVKEMSAFEDAQLREREAAVRRRAAAELLLLFVAGGATLALALVGGFFIIADLRARSALEARMEEAVVQLRAILDSISDGVIVADPQGRFTVFNPAAARIMGADKSNLSADPAQWSRICSTHRLDGTAFPSEELPLSLALRGRHAQADILLRKEGREDVVIATAASPIAAEDGRALGGVVVFRDVTELKRAEKELERARDVAVRAAKFKADFLANMSHELRTPLNAVIGMTGLLADTPLDLRQRGFVDTVRNAGEALLTLINDILDLSKIEAGKMTLERIDFDLREVVESAVELVAQRAQAKGLELAVDVPEGSATGLLGDPGRLRQVLLNLLGNAVKFTEKGEVVVSVAAEPAEGGRVAVRVGVRDTGIGIPEEGRRRLFSAFVQADSSTTRKYGGTGLGLAISKQLVELMGGEIGVESEPGKGSEFWFTARFEPGTPAAPRRAAAPDVAGLRVLVVDDNATNRLIVSTQTLAWGLAPESASSGPEALAALRAAALEGKPFRIALLDMQMPDMDGLALARAVRSDELLSGTRLIMMSSAGTALAEGERRAAGLSACLSKPVKRSTLLDAIMDAVAAAPSPLAPPPAAAAARARSRGRRVLVVEDNSVNQMVVRLQLEKLGTPCDVASSGEEGLQMLASGAYAIVFMDCQMPGLDGYETTARLRAGESGKERRPVVAMTANALSGDRERCLAAGMDDYVPKPVRVEELAAALARWDPAVDPAPLAALKEAGGPEALDNILAEFERAGARTAEKLAAAAQAGDAKAAAAAAHALKGSSGSVGAMRLHDLCAAAESGAKGAGPWAEPAAAAAEEFKLCQAELRRAARGEGPARPAPSGAGPAPLSAASLAGLREIASPEDFKRLLRQFIEHSRGYAAKLAEAAGKGDWTEVRKVCHTLRGSSGSLGAQRLHALCEGTEALVEEGRGDEAADLIARMPGEIDRFEEAARKEGVA